MKNSYFSCTSQRFSIRKYSFGAASVLLGVFLLSGVQTAHADEQTAVSESTASITSDNGVVSEKVTSSNTEIALSEATVSVPKDSLEPAKALSSTVTPEKTSESSQHVETVTTNETHKVENTTEAISTVEEKVNVATNTDKSSDKKITTPSISNEANKKIESEVREDKETEKVTVTEKISDPKVPEIKTDNKPTIPSTGYSRLFSVGNIRRPMSTNPRIGDDYPAAWRFAEGYDQWGYAMGNCTSFVAYRLKNVNHIEPPRALGNGAQWGASARGYGYRVDKTPARGSVAYFDDGGYGHVAWVADVRGDNVIIEEYNWYINGIYDHSYHTQTLPISHYTGYIHFKDLKGGNTSIPDTPTPTDNTGSNLASSGSYQFTERVSIKAEPKMSAPELAYYEAGNTVNYDKTLQADGYVWISYLSYAGNRRYIPVQKLSTVESASTISNPSKPSIPNSGVYTFKGYASIKAEPKISAPELAYYDAGNTVNYDSLIQADGHYWISYLSYSGARRYIAIS